MHLEPEKIKLEPISYLVCNLSFGQIVFVLVLIIAALQLAEHSSAERHRLSFDKAVLRIIPIVVLGKSLLLLHTGPTYMKCISLGSVRSSHLPFIMQ